MCFFLINFALKHERQNEWAARANEKIEKQFKTCS